ncbi:flocculation protein FLO11-like [Stylophora pistillata]|nr:flocculation protein FLO11-like [Stylophora pistillata]XP_022778968.1 flocculation protein FLO11-like [Stylophora pistillata]XP_022779023.1 flocculation protein FLO11-like [Stylophora pistillata]
MNSRRQLTRKKADESLSVNTFIKQNMLHSSLNQEAHDLKVLLHKIDVGKCIPLPGKIGFSIQYLPSAAKHFGKKRVGHVTEDSTQRKSRRILNTGTCCSGTCLGCTSGERCDKFKRRSRRVKVAARMSVANPCLTLSAKGGENSCYLKRNQLYSVPPEMPGSPLKQQRSSQGLSLPGAIPQQASKSHYNRTYSATTNEVAPVSCISSEASSYRKTSASENGTLPLFSIAASSNMRTLKVEDANAQQGHSPSSTTTVQSENPIVAPLSSPNMHLSGSLRPFVSAASPNVRSVKVEDANKHQCRFSSSITTVHKRNSVFVPFSSPIMFPAVNLPPSPDMASSNVRPAVETVHAGNSFFGPNMHLSRNLQPHFSAASSNVRPVVTTVLTVNSTVVSLSSPNMHPSGRVRPSPSTASLNVQPAETVVHSGTSIVLPLSSPNMHPSRNLRPYFSAASSNVRPGVTTELTVNSTVVPLSSPNMHPSGKVRPFPSTASLNVQPAETAVHSGNSIVLPLSSPNMHPSGKVRPFPSTASLNVQPAETAVHYGNSIVLPLSSPNMHPSSSLRLSPSTESLNVQSAVNTVHTRYSTAFPLSSPNIHPSGNLRPSHSVASSNVTPVVVVNAQQSRLPQSVTVINTGNSVVMNTVPPQTPSANLQRCYPLVTRPFFPPSGLQQSSIQCVPLAPQPTPVYRLVQPFHFATVSGSSMSKNGDIPVPSAQSVSTNLNENRAGLVHKGTAHLDSHQEVLPKPWTQFPQCESLSERKRQLDQACDKLTRCLIVVTSQSKIRGDFDFLVQNYRTSCEQDPSNAIIIDNMEALKHFLKITECKLKEESHVLQNSCQSLQSHIEKYQESIRTEGKNYKKLMDAKLCTEKNINIIDENKAAEIKRENDEMKTELSELRVKMAELRKEKDKLSEKWLRLADA